MAVFVDAQWVVGSNWTSNLYMWPGSTLSYIDCLCSAVSISFMVMYFIIWFKALDQLVHFTAQVSITYRDVCTLAEGRVSDILEAAQITRKQYSNSYTCTCTCIMWVNHIALNEHKHCQVTLCTCRPDYHPKIGCRQNVCWVLDAVALGNICIYTCWSFCQLL